MGQSSNNHTITPLVKFLTEAKLFLLSSTSLETFQFSRDNNIENVHQTTRSNFQESLLIILQVCCSLQGRCLWEHPIQGSQQKDSIRCDSLWFLWSCRCCSIHCFFCPIEEIWCFLITEKIALIFYITLHDSSFLFICRRDFKLRAYDITLLGLWTYTVGK